MPAINFVNHVNYELPPVPASEKLISLYAVFLARRLKPASVKQYLNIIRILHLECGYVNPIKDSSLVKSTLSTECFLVEDNTI